MFTGFCITLVFSFSLTFLAVMFLLFIAMWFFSFSTAVFFVFLVRVTFTLMVLVHAISGISRRSTAALMQTVSTTTLPSPMRTRSVVATAGG